jgi:hypothetical protein
VTPVGIVVGTLEGEVAGALDGWDEGIKVGTTEREGNSVRSLLGNREDVGRIDSDGTSEGIMLGLPDGLLLG